MKDITAGCFGGNCADGSQMFGCENCPLGTISPVELVDAKSDDCTAGTYSLAGASVCTNCAAGKFSDAVGATASDTCSECAAGKFSAVEGATASDTCSDCGAGKFSDAVGASVASTCADCEAGKYSELQGVTEVRHVALQ